MADFLGRSIGLPIVASSCCATENAGNIRRVYDAGIRAVILKSCADYTREPTDEKRAFRHENVEMGHLIYASSPFQNEILTLEEELELIKELEQMKELVIVPSFTAVDLNPGSWLPACLKLEAAGADGIQLDFFYMENMIGSDSFSWDMTELLSILRETCRIPIMPKLNINLPARLIIPILSKAGIENVSLLDSIRSPYLERTESGYRIGSEMNPETTSCFGHWQLPLTIEYAYVAAQAGLKVCAGGGITCSDDMKKLFAVGADTVQSATMLSRDAVAVCHAVGGIGR